ncbi:hypothetical protein DAPPUDRAFT_320585 [Daphnia pulex]|uniref:Peptidase S1 domain-containing protein n=1 Tax=Daphnia pulex TaxID=6669 RepID=E9GQI8_DAPPU|nr:hypothetical protein DAPPUDRAFT_320585 [Daphnia pulex]|eukprot:EFX78324.1 hypothetical protein DAPPUDRAFT_320585 [Daphnia pulex]
MVGVQFNQSLKLLDKTSNSVSGNNYLIGESENFAYGSGIPEKAKLASVIVDDKICREEMRKIELVFRDEDFTSLDNITHCYSIILINLRKSECAAIHVAILFYEEKRDTAIAFHDLICSASDILRAAINAIAKFDGSGYTVPFQGKNWYGQIANPGFIPLPSFNPYYPMAYGQQQQQLSGWPYPSGYPSRLEEKPIDVKQVAATCGGPATMPKTGGLRVALQKSSDGQLFCTGTLISDTQVLLAAQCLEA